MSRCTHWHDGHKFEPRYDTTPPKPNEIGRIEGYALDRLVNALATKVYVCDVCVRCGVVVKRQ